MSDAPSIAALTRRLAETPSELLSDSRVDLAAVVSDLVRDLGGEIFDAKRAAPFSDQSESSRRSLLLIAAWLLHDDWFVSQQRFAASAYDFLAGGLDEAASVVAPGQFVTDPDRREELARRALRALAVVPLGETSPQAADRLNTFDSVERIRVLRDTRAAQERTRKVQEAMARKAAEEAASAYGRE